MSEETRLRFQQHYHAMCQERDWMTEDGEHVWPVSAEDRAAMARELFGLALIFGTDATFQHVKEQIGAETLQATPTRQSALATIQAMNDEQKSAILTLVDDVLDFSVYKFTIQLDRFDHGFLSLRFQSMNEECEPEPETEVEINPCGLNEMFQDAVRWKKNYSMNDEIGRPKDPNPPATNNEQPTTDK